MCPGWTIGEEEERRKQAIGQKDDSMKTSGQMSLQTHCTGGKMT